MATSLVKRAQEAGQLTVDTYPFFSYVSPKERIDAPAFGPGAGMVIKPEVIEQGIADCEQRHGRALRIFFSPQGTRLTQPLLQCIQEKIKQHNNHCLVVAARYEGIDARAQEEYADIVLSLGDFVVMGGDLPAMLFLEGLFRLIPGVVGKQESVAHDSFTGPFVDWPTYCPPLEWHGKRVPDIVRSGNHAAIAQWRLNQAAEQTVKHHFSWLRAHVQEPQDIQEASKYIPAHYTALMHSGVNLPGGRVGTSSVTSFDIHDIARSSRTFGMKNYFIVTPVQDQQKIVQKLLHFWQEGVGIGYNENRHKAVQIVRLLDSLDMVVDYIEKQEGKKPLIIATSARDTQGRQITYYDQEKVWAEQRPVLFLFGTALGLAQEVLDRCDYILLPIKGFYNFNHLSVRSAVAIILDRWLGISIKRYTCNKI